MKLGIQAKYVKQLQKQLNSNNDVLTSARWKDDEIREYIDFSRLTTKELDAFEKLLEKLSTDTSTSKKYGPVYRKFTEWKVLFTGAVDKDAPVKKLDLIPAAFKSAFKELDRKWVFIEGEDGAPNPYYITKVWYKEAHYLRGGDYVPATTHITLAGYRQGKQVKAQFEWRARALGKGGKTVTELLRARGMIVENKAAVDQYLAEFKRMLKLQEQVGLQMEAHGTADMETTKNSYWAKTEYVAMVREGIPTKVVIEEEEVNTDRRNESETFVTKQFWSEVRAKINGDEEEYDEDAGDYVVPSHDDDDDDQDKDRVELPIHPYLKVFDLDKHRYVNIHTKNLLDYKWDKTLGDKLIIKQEDKNLIDLLMHQTGQNVADIIKGKMNGVIVLATGTPGVGKTLTAEVFSEMIEKPLYNVQCSQLGIDISTIEKNLQEILDRASRWGAILLVDEADVYIRKRGDDIEQNAIVGVFLRLIEYYRGVLFMTSNRGEEIDDAIISRATAWVKYDLPTPERLGKIWEVLGKQYGANFTKTDITKLLQMLPGISGRTVRNLLKLARLLSGGEPVTVKMIDQVKGYQALENKS